MATPRSRYLVFRLMSVSNDPMIPENSLKPDVFSLLSVVCLKIRSVVQII
jgi:regulator of PEP synthase PpsR (kinase-PPPase family)